MKNRKHQPKLIDGYPAEYWGKVTPQLLEKVYQREQKLERDRNRDYYKRGKGRNLVPLGKILPKEAPDGSLNDDENQERFVSDRYAGVERMISAIDQSEQDEYDAREKMLATVAIIAAVAPHLVVPLLLILKNGNNRKESVCELKQLGSERKATRQCKNTVALLKRCLG